MRFHGRTVKGWILGPAGEPPAGRLLRVSRVRSAVRFFDPSMLELLRWVSERYLAPLATVIERSHPPRVASEEREELVARVRAGGADVERSRSILAKYGGPDALLRPGGVTWLRPLPREEVDACVAGVEACVARGRQALVLVPEAAPLPATARAVLERFGERAVPFLGGDGRERYRRWLEIRAGLFDVVVATRSGVFAPLSSLGLVWISREAHPGHREERSPHHHVRDVATGRARLHGAACVLSSLSPSVETASACAAGSTRAARPPRSLERETAPLVETTPPEAEDRSARLGRLLAGIRSAALIVSRRGYGVARICRTCGQPAACAACGGPIVVAEGEARCSVCGARGTCASCGGTTFGLERGGAEHVARWAAARTRVPVLLEAPGAAPPVPGRGSVVVGTAAAVKDVGPAAVDLVAILDPDRAITRPGLHAGEQAVATWMEAAAWAGPRSGPGRVLAQTRRPGHPAIQALVRWDPTSFLVTEAERRAEAGFPPNHPVFRVVGGAELEAALRAAGPETLLAAAGPEGTVCLVAVRPGDLPHFREEVLRMVGEGTVIRVEAEPHL